MSEMKDVFERSFDGEDDPRLQCARVLTRREAGAVLEYRGDLVEALSSPPPSCRPTREEVARVIGSFVVYDDKGGPDTEVLHDVIGGDYDEATRRVYALTDQILSLLALDPGVGEGRGSSGASVPCAKEHTPAQHSAGWRDIATAPALDEVLLFWPAGNQLPPNFSIGRASEHGAYRAPTHWRPLPAHPNREA